MIKLVGQDRTGLPSLHMRGETIGDKTLFSAILELQESLYSVVLSSSHLEQ